VVSPGKTWEGAIGGVLAGFITAFLFLRISGHSEVGFSMFVLVLCMSIAGQLGDLGESMLKRNHGVKDSGHILPGHGGLLDRIDALLFSIPILYIYLSIFVV
jgi:phosphatidate cytidylyltransferase